MRVSTSKILKNGRAFLLAHDQGLEHGPVDLNAVNVDPKYIFDIALEGMYTGLIVHAGLAEKYYHSYYRDVPLIIKLNGRTSLIDKSIISRPICSVDRAVKIGASAVGYKMSIGDSSEPEQFSELGRILEQAHDYGLPVIAWVYLNGPRITNELDTDKLAYAARIGLELGADFIKIKYNNDPEGFKWIVKCAGRAKVLVAGGAKMDEHDLFRKVDEVMKTGITGMAIGRNVWQHDKPYAMSKAVRMMVQENMSVDDALRLFEEEAHKEHPMK